MRRLKIGSMKPKRKPVVDLAEPTAAQIARMSGVSISRVYRLLQEGRTGAQIVAAAQQRKEEAALNVLPSKPVKGHGQSNGVLSFSAAQAQRETWTARLRELEFLERQGALIPVSYVKHWGGGFILGVRDELRKVGELTDALAAESDPARVQKILDDWLSRVCEKLHRLESLWAPQPPGVM